MGIAGALGENDRETGIIEEIMLENRYQNPLRNWTQWQSVLYEKVRYEPAPQGGAITLLLNCTCNDLQMEGNRIKSVKGWQLTTETWHTVEATLFADCSGDSILAPLSGAEFRLGREARSEFGEAFGPETEPDQKTMGMSCLVGCRETDSPQPYIPPFWANKYLSCDDLAHRRHNVFNINFWWIELGGEQDSIHDTEEIRDELLKIAFGAWDHVKNHCDQKEENENWVLDWVGFLPGKRESRRYVGDYLMTQLDVSAEGRFDDLVGYGGWTMDDHPPGGFNWPGKPTVHHPAPSPFGIPYRSLYSRNIENLVFAGRNISVTHAAMSATRVMATCSIIGQAVGTAAAISLRDNLSPRDIYHQRIEELKQTLMEDDCYLPWNTRQTPPLTQEGELLASEGDPEPLRNGIDRPVDGQDNGWSGSPGSWVEYRFASPRQVRNVRIIVDSELTRPWGDMGGYRPLKIEPWRVPETILRAFRIEALDDNDDWQVIIREKNNYQRLVRLETDVKTRAIRFVPEVTWGAGRVHLFAFDVDGD